MRFMLNIGGRTSLVGRTSLAFLCLIGREPVDNRANVDGIGAWLLSSCLWIRMLRLRSVRLLMMTS